MKNKYYQNLEAAKLKQPKRIELRTVYSDVVTQMKHAKNLTLNEGDLNNLFNKLTVEVRKQVSFSKAVKKDLDTSLKKLENAAKELGTKPETVDIYKEAKQLLKHTEVQEKLFNKMLAAVKNFG